MAASLSLPSCSSLCPVSLMNSIKSFTGYSDWLTPLQGRVFTHIAVIKDQSRESILRIIFFISSVIP
eukprot:12412825-Karenia_brevis.AAC.1